MLHWHCFTWFVIGEEVYPAVIRFFIRFSCLVNHLAQDLRFPDSGICAQSENMSRYLIPIPDAARGDKYGNIDISQDRYIQDIFRRQLSPGLRFLRNIRVGLPSLPPPILLLSVSRYSASFQNKYLTIHIYKLWLGKPPREMLKLMYERQECNQVKS